LEGRVFCLKTQTSKTLLDPLNGIGGGVAFAMLISGVILNCIPIFLSMIRLPAFLGQLSSY
jgi:hypothetical protein